MADPIVPDEQVIAALLADIEDVPADPSDLRGPYTFVAVLDDGTEVDGGDPPSAVNPLNPDDPITARIVAMTIVARASAADHPFTATIHIPEGCRAVFGFRYRKIVNWNARQAQEAWFATCAGWDGPNGPHRLWLRRDGTVFMTAGDPDEAQARTEKSRRGHHDRDA